MNKIICKSNNLINKIKINIKYLKNDNLINILTNGIDNNEIYKKVEEEIENYHLNKLSKNGKGQTKYLVEYLKDKKTDLKLMENIFKNYNITIDMFRTTNMVIENAFITKYKQAMFNNSPQEDICKTCNLPDNERHLLGMCKECQYDTIKRHDIVINEIFKYLIDYKLNGNYSSDRKYIIFPWWFLRIRQNNRKSYR